MARSDGLVVRVGVPGISPVETLSLARKIVRQELPGDWIVALMGRESRDVSVRRPADKSNPTVAQAFDLAYRLRQHRLVEDCEPSLLLPDEMPQMMRPEFATVSRSSSSSSGGEDSDLSCSAAPDWALAFCRVAAAWDAPRPPGGKSRGQGIIVGHPDTGYTDHPELDAARVLVSRGRDFEEGDLDPRDTLSGFSPGHGTGTGSVIMSSVGPGRAVTGVAPLAELVPLRITTSVVLFSFAKLAEAIRFAADEGHHVLSISLGGPLYSRFLHRSVQYAIERGVIIVAAAGNVWPFVVYPAKLDEVIAVAACNCSKQVWADSASGAQVDITAPGESVWRAQASTTGFTVAPGSGTSFATAITAGAAALWLAHHGRAALINRFGMGGLAAAFKEVLVSKGFDAPNGWDASNYGPGLLNVDKLLRAALPSSVAAGGMSALNANPTARRLSQVDDIVALFPNDDPARIRAALANAMNVNESQLTIEVRDVADEIAYHAVLNPEVRRRLSGKQSHSRRVVSSTKRKPYRPPAMSARLKRMLD
ncbi:MAG: S8 family serine peptidase [Pirellulales bacterium]|nr:S8 family serine peptidase [Pirellulales bacterium]